MGCCWDPGQDQVCQYDLGALTEEGISASKAAVSPRGAFLYLTLHQGKVLHLLRCLVETLGVVLLGGSPGSCMWGVGYSRRVFCWTFSPGPVSAESLNGVSHHSALFSV